jgi:hypothetical protein
LLFQVIFNTFTHSSKNEFNFFCFFKKNEKLKIYKIENKK